MTDATASMTLQPCPVVIGVNVDVETVDHANAGQAGLFGRYSYGRYGVREGVWRMLDLYAELGIPATFFCAPDDLRRHPGLTRALLDGGHEIAVRGTVQAKAGDAETLDALARDREALQALTGSAPAGWRALNGLVTEATLPALARAGYRYDSSFQDDDQPYVMQDGGDVLVELPVFDYLTDAPFFAQRHTHQRAAKAWTEEADAQYCAGGYVNFTLHTRGDVGSGRLPQMRLVADFLRILQGRPGVGFYRAADLAVLWAQARPEREPYPRAPAPQV
ncbi:polysaccharide deacetylase family protein [Bordetella genomosp. 13]|uniref:polysaccharide deacetylase family protein n=1 Tax=Bordetella genomosp. 13 TaxID=463040 RepID=UPI00119CFF91|nr:polysaccharide deacetylase family protein [Bordetella genomosp. 13]